MKYAWIAAAVCLLILAGTFLGGQTLDRECEDLLGLIDGSLYAADHGQPDEAWAYLAEAACLWEERAVWWHLFVPQSASVKVSMLFITAQEYLSQDETLFFDVSAAQLQDALCNIASDQRLTLSNVF